jgi:hypothetical protein
MIGRGAASGLVLVVLISLFAACATMDPWQDVRIESEVKARLVAEKSANLTRLGVVSRQAVVHLTGTVASPDQKALAEDLAKSVAGVRRVVNTLEVQPARWEFLLNRQPQVLPGPSPGSPRWTAASYGQKSRRPRSGQGGAMGDSSLAIATSGAWCSIQ